jgi:hypothetical protein
MGTINSFDFRHAVVEDKVKRSGFEDQERGTGL